MDDAAQETVADLLRAIRPKRELGPDEDDPELRRAAEEAARAENASLAAPPKVTAKALGLRADERATANWSSGVSGGVSGGAEMRSAASQHQQQQMLTGRLGVLADQDAVLDRLAEQEAHAAFRAEEAGRRARERRDEKRVARDKKNRRDRLARRIVDAGFTREWADEALKHCAEDAEAFERVEALEDRARTERGSRRAPGGGRDGPAAAAGSAGGEEEDPHEAAAKARDAANDARLAEALDWLCLFAPKEDLPDAFKTLSRSNTAGGALQSRGSVADAAARAADAARRAADLDADLDDDDGSDPLVGVARAPPDPHVALLQRAMLARLAAYGFARAEAREALEDRGWVEEDATYALLRSLQPERDDDRGGDAARGLGGGEAASPEAEAEAAREAALERGEEALALDAILDGAFDATGSGLGDEIREDKGGGGDENENQHAQSRSDGAPPSASSSRLWTVRVDAEDPSRWRACVVEAHFPPGSLYPTAEPPLLAVLHPNLPPSTRRSLAAQLAAHAAELVGEPCVFALVAWLKEHLPAVLDERGEPDPEVLEREAREARERALEAELEAEREARERARESAGRSNKVERTFAKIEARAREADDAERARLARLETFRRLIKEQKEKEEGRKAAARDAARRTKAAEGSDATTDEEEKRDAEEDAHDATDASDADGDADADIDAASAASSASVAPSLDARLRRWEAEHARRVAAARAATEAAEAAFFERRGAASASASTTLVEPNTARTAAKARELERRAAEEETRARDAAAEKAREGTAKGRREKLRATFAAEKIRASRGATPHHHPAAAAGPSTGAVENAAAGGSGARAKTSWLSKHVERLGLRDVDERDGVAEDASAAPDDEVARAAAASFAFGAAASTAASELQKTEAEEAERLAFSLASIRAVSERLLRDERRKASDPAWTAMKKKRADLPAFAFRAAVTSVVAKCRSCVVSGATGCGKTTQVPQFILEDAIAANRGGECSIIITQPRRLSAIAVAERVAAERRERVGGVVGYSIRLESRQSKDTRLLFCTTGILLRRLQSDPDLAGVSHVVVDEVHERDLLSDFLLVVLRDLAERREDFTLVAMSATVNASLFKTYFEAVVPGECGCVEIPGRTFPVAEYRLEDAIEATGYVCDPDGEYALGSAAANGGRGPRRTFNPLSGGGDKGGGSNKKARAELKASLERGASETIADETRALYPGYSESTMRCLQTLDESVVNLELIGDLVALIADEYEEGAILIFLPGMAEIRGCHERLLGTLEDVHERFVLIPLHSTLSSEEQRLTFSKPPAGVRKVVMATNIAETSVTIDDVVFVVDAGRVRETRYDPVTRMSSLVTAWCSRASSRQRRGRAGRVREGYCFHLYSTKTEQSELADFTTPEIMRTPLDALCLQIKCLKLGDVRAFLKRAIEPPPEAAVDAALRSLAELDAMDASDELTPLGHHLADLPVDARLGKMMLYGAVFGCLDPVLTIAAGVGFRSPFLSPMDRREEADEARRKLAGAGATSDHLALVRAYAGWIRARERGRGFERDFLAKAFLSAQTLRQISEMRQQYADLLDQIGFLRTGAGALGKKKEPPKTEAEASASPEPKTGPDPTTGPSLAADAAPFTPGRKPIPAPKAAAANSSAAAPSRAAATPRGAAAAPAPPLAPLSRRAEKAEALRLASANAGDEPLVRAVICAGMFPNVALVEPRASSLDAAGRGGGGRGRGRGQQSKVAVRTRGDGEVALHPTSVCAGVSAFRHPFLVFHEKVKTAKVYVRDATMVGAYPLLLFGGKIKVDHARSSATCDGWIRLRAAPRVAVLFKSLRAELDALLMRKIADPSLDVSEQGGALVRTVVELLESEDATRDARAARGEEERAGEESVQPEGERRITTPEAEVKGGGEEEAKGGEGREGRRGLV